MRGRLGYHALALLVTAIWGVTFVCTKVLISAGLSPSQIYFIRFVIAYAGIWLMCLRDSGSRKVLSFSVKDELVFVFLGITGGSAYFITENSAIGCTQACNVAFIVCIAPLLTVLLTLAIKRFYKGPYADSLEDISNWKPLAAGTLLAFAGMAAVLFDRNSVSFSPKGDLLAFGAALCWALYSVAAGIMTSRYGSLFATRKVFFYGLLTILPFVAGKDPDIATLTRPEVLGTLLFLSLVASLACFILWNIVIVGLGNVTATNYVYLNPFFTLVTSVAFLSESLTLQSAIGCLAIVVGVVIGTGDKKIFERNKRKTFAQ